MLLLVGNIIVVPFSIIMGRLADRVKNVIIVAWLAVAFIIFTVALVLATDTVYIQYLAWILANLVSILTFSMVNLTSDF